MILTIPDSARKKRSMWAGFRKVAAKVVRWASGAPRVAKEEPQATVVFEGRAEVESPEESET